MSEIWETVIVPPSQAVSHVCLAGRLVSNDWNLIQSLNSRYLVTLMERVDLLDRRSTLQDTQLLVLDCSRDAEAALESLTRLKREFPELCVLLVDGGLSQRQIAAAFKQGAKDYFAFPYDVRLLVERMDSLCTRRATAENLQSP